MRKSLLASAALLAASAAPLTAHAGDVSVSTSIDYVTDYVFRGVSLADSAIQPGVSVSAGDFTVGAWFSTGVGDTSALASDEVDLYASYSVPLSDKFSTTVGLTYYHYPQGGSLFSTNNGGSGSYEVSASLGFNTVLSPSVSAYYDFTLETFTLQGSVSHSLPVAEKTKLNLGGTAGLVDGNSFSYEYGLASASLSYGFADNASAYIGGNFSINSEDALNFRDLIQGDGDDTLLWFGTGLSASF